MPGRVLRAQRSEACARLTHSRLKGAEERLFQPDVKRKVDSSEATIEMAADVEPDDAFDAMWLGFFCAFAPSDERDRL